LAAGLMIAAFCGLPRGDVSTDASRPIAALRVGDHVVTDAPWKALAADHHLRIEDRFPRNHDGASRNTSAPDSSDLPRPQAVESALRASCSGNPPGVPSNGRSHTVARIPEGIDHW
jgi:hypothetical protein